MELLESVRYVVIVAGLPLIVGFFFSIGVYLASRIMPVETKLSITYDNLDKNPDKWPLLKRDAKGRYLPSK